MLTASCPNCGSPIRFGHADSLSTVCDSCDSVIQRQDRELSLIGKVSAMPRDLSAVQVGATGIYKEVPFRVMGGMRKVRSRIRWNEWYLRFDDGTHGWLSESNGQHFLFLPSPEPAPVDLSRLSVGAEVQLHGHPFRVSERAEFRVAAATGELPFRLDPERSYPFADLRQLRGAFLATVDGSDVPPSLWVGALVHLPDLKMEGLRPFAGWSDPVLVNFAGPEIESVRSASCPNCSASLTVRAPGAAARLACEYCGTELALGDLAQPGVQLAIDGEPQAGPGSSQHFRPTLDLGQRGSFDGVDWQIIGAMMRFVRYDGAVFSWTEYLLHNPYRGTRWLIEDATGHWNLVDPAESWPEMSGTRMDYDGNRYRHFQRGRATVGAVAGEFTWEVHKGDEAVTNDFISPPHGLSSERTQDEETWSQSTYVTHTDVEKAFDITLTQPFGVYLNQPNPYAAMGARIFLHTGALFLASLFLVALSLGLSANEVLHTASHQVALTGKSQVWVTEAFEVPDTSRNRTKVRLGTPYDPYTAGAGVSLLDTVNGQAYTPGLSYMDNAWTGRTASLPPGTYIARVELAFASEQRSLGSSPLHLTVIRDAPWPVLPSLLILLSFVLPIIWLGARGNFETRRWSQSDYG